MGGGPKISNFGQIFTPEWYLKKTKLKNNDTNHLKTFYFLLLFIIDIKKEKLRVLATTNVRRLGSVNNCPSKKMVIVGPYLTFKTYS